MADSEHVRAIEVDMFLRMAVRRGTIGADFCHVRVRLEEFVED